ncbi:ECF RNA polymerase sigma factor SigE [Gemmata obscuriglobus]|nr:sigma-70 family RNA polymerase sigma factor [Gemmata obscuriglobus]QEG30224.1 ECF RNA polymerase sigma factor SigE [Gemmata obscuriglobus]VTS09548.1 sigma-70 family rna polymerase sigma factor : RNA polymerase sigma factor, sigma-70 family OS=Singulisphaera acidiphila (strain ATCC BAA-1392 / DSM 18658 / VKM B-2454 / MOB10) GN=Sinac_7487 PE=4 SV=1: Sigma70_r2: Sigma70_r4_2 [Gemmata obscuriglobus UQM 2246]
MPVSTARVLRVIADEEQTDAELLGRFVDRRDEDAFALLVRRHGAMVYGICRRILPEQDAEDAFQATFLVLAQKARTAAPREVANWLYGVARRAALLAHRSIVRRKERTGDMPDRPAESDPLVELRAALDEELSRLPEAYRTVIVLCDLESRTRKEAALILGWPEGTVAGRLSRAREMLAKRLARHAPAVSVAAVLAGTPALPASAPSAIRVAALASSGRPTGPVAALTQGVLNAMLVSKLKSAIAIVMVLGLLAVGAAGLVDRRASAQVDKPPVEERTAPPPKKAPDFGDLQGRWVVVAMEGDGEKVPADVLEGMRWAIKGDQITASQPRSTGKMAFKLNPDKTPKEIDLTSLDGTLKGTTSPGIYELDGPKLRVCFGEKVRPTTFATAQGDGRTMIALEKEPFTAWGKEVGGLQAGLGIKEERAYRIGETVTLLVRVRNVGKETVKFEYIRQYLDENPPGVTGADGKAIPQATVAVMGVLHAPIKVSLEPGKEAVLETRIHGASGVPYELRSDGGTPMTKNHPLKVGTGKVVLQYERVLGSSSIGALKVDPMIARLSTGKLELEVSDQKDSISLPTHDGMRQLKGKDAEAYQTTNAWLAERLKEADSIKVGSTYADVTKHFRTDGGLAQVGKNRFVMILCPYIKIDVEFEKGGALAPTAKVTKVSRPYLEPEYAD